MGNEGSKECATQSAAAPDAASVQQRPAYAAKLDPYFQKGEESTASQKMVIADIVQGALVASSQGDIGVAVTRKGSFQIESKPVPVEMYEMKQPSGLQGRFVHVAYRFVLNNQEMTVELKHTHEMGGEFKMWVNGEKQGSGQSWVWDTGGSHKFEVAGIPCEMIVKLEGSLISAYSQFYTYRLNINGARISDTVVSTSTQAITKDTLKAFYAKHEPKNVDRVDEIMSSYSDGELAAALKSKYGETPTDMISVEALTAFYKQHDPSNVPRVKEIIAAYNSAQLREALTKKYGSAPGSQAATARIPTSGVRDKGKITKEILTAFYHKHDPQSVSRVDEILSSYTTTELNAVLKQKYGETPVELTPPKISISKEELVKFYRKHDPSAIKRADDILLAYGAEELHQALKDKYGESPGQPVAAVKASTSVASTSQAPSSKLQQATGSAHSNLADLFQDAVEQFDLYDSKYQRTKEQITYTDALHKQATLGDIDDSSTASIFDAEKYAAQTAWTALKGTPSTVAKEMYIQEMKLQVLRMDSSEISSFKESEASSNEEFNTAVSAMQEYDSKYERTVAQRISLHGLYQQAMLGNCNDNSKLKPGFFDDAEKQEKWNAWKNLDGISQQKAAAMYCEEAKGQMS